ncbi:hypothetical protein K438DRAFT_79468 [Mycena galopus ATCC 62051]|nr:hypothetical protein K438DRAFT_79468 [Mycena galopus ATCC 62051]
MVKIYVEDCDENLTEYDVDLAASVRRLKGEIEETEGNSRWEQCLKFEGRELYDDRSLFSSFIREHSVLQLSENDTGSLGAIGAYMPGRGRFEELRVEPYLALYDWDGDMKHPKTIGVPLRKGMRVEVNDIATKRGASGWFFSFV